MVSSASNPVNYADVFKDDLEASRLWTYEVAEVRERLLDRSEALYVWPLPACPAPVSGLTVVTHANADLYYLPSFTSPPPVDSPVGPSADTVDKTEDTISPMDKLAEPALPASPLTTMTDEGTEPAAGAEASPPSKSPLPQLSGCVSV
ncbi:hypothetical protein JCM11641_005368 [Rhodosporidiobolus odoratus]